MSRPVSEPQSWSTCSGLTGWTKSWAIGVDVYSVRLGRFVCVGLP